MGKENKCIEDYLKPPEFEVRCDKFVAEVSETIAPKYPDLKIDPTNETTFVSSMSPEFKKRLEDNIYFKGKSKQWIQEYRDVEIRLAKIDEILSTIENVASVDIYGWEGLEAVPDIEKAVKDVFDLAKKHRGKYEPNTINGKRVDMIDTEDPDLPQAHLVFAFTD